MRLVEEEAEEAAIMVEEVEEAGFTAHNTG